MLLYLLLYIYSQFWDEIPIHVLSYTCVEDRTLSPSPSIEKKESVLEHSSFWCTVCVSISPSLQILTVKAPLSSESICLINIRGMSLWWRFVFLASNAHLHLIIAITDDIMVSSRENKPIAMPTLWCHNGELLTTITKASEFVVLFSKSSVTFPYVIATDTFITAVQYLYFLLSHA